MATKKSTQKTQCGRERTRNFATVVYPESAPENWVEILDSSHVAALISPLHDKDVNPDGSTKKPHYHVLLIYDGVKNFETQVKPLIQSFGGVGREEINSLRGYARYLCHLDNPEKAQYSTTEIRALGGADYEALIHLPSDDLKMLKDIFEYIRVNQIYSLAELLDICAQNNEDWFSLIAETKAYIVDKYIKSVQWEGEHSYMRKADRAVVDPKTGELQD